MTPIFSAPLATWVLCDLEVAGERIRKTNGCGEEAGESEANAEVEVNWRILGVFGALRESVSGSGSVWRVALLRRWKTLSESESLAVAVWLCVSFPVLTFLSTWVFSGASRTASTARRLELRADVAGGGGAGREGVDRVPAIRGRGGGGRGGS